MSIQIPVEYNKSKTLQALRFHFISKREIKILLILVNVFAITAAGLFWTKKIRPEPFLLGTCIWLLLMIGIWYILPITVYRKSPLFKQSFIATITASGLRFETEQGYSFWDWKQFQQYTETPHFIHLYINDRSFLLLPTETLTDDIRHEIRGVIRTHVKQA